LRIEHLGCWSPSRSLASGADAQWLNSPTPGSPRTRHGKPDLAAAVPRAADGKPDLSGVWHVQSPPQLAEMKRLYGDRVGETNVPGMEAGTISKYAINILVDFRPAESPMQPEAAEIQPAPAGNQSCRSLSAIPTPRLRPHGRGNDFRRRPDVHQALCHQVHRGTRGRHILETFCNENEKDRVHSVHR
jgi:hypothetical protein